MDSEEHKEFDEWVASDDLMDHALDIRRDPGPKQVHKIDDRILACYYAIFAMSNIPEDHLQQLKKWRAFQDAHFTLDQSVYDSMKLADPDATAPNLPITYLGQFHLYFKYILEAFTQHNFLEEYASRYSNTPQFTKYKNSFNPPKGITVEAKTGLRCLDYLIKTDGYLTTGWWIDNYIFWHVTQNVPLFPPPQDSEFTILEWIYKYIKDVDPFTDRTSKELNVNFRRRPTAVVRDGGENVNPDDVVWPPPPAQDTRPPPEPRHFRPLSPRGDRARLPALLAKLQALTL